MYGCNQSNFLAPDVKDSEFSNLVCVRKDRTQLREIQKTTFSHNRIPTREGMIWRPGVFPRTRSSACALLHALWGRNNANGKVL
jgi:hypothetical protein